MNKVLGVLPLWVMNHTRIVKFVIIGGSLYLLSALLLFLFKEKMKIDAAQAYVFVTLLTYILQFVFNAVFTWADRNVSELDEVFIFKYLPAKLVIWTINQAVYSFWLMLDLHYQVANVFTVLMIMVLNYLIFDRWIFSK